MKTEERKEFNNILFEKILDFIEHFYPGIYDNSKERYAEEQEDKFEILKDESNFMEDYNAWFLVKMVLPNNTTVVQMAESFPEDYFNELEKKMLNNFLNYHESVFRILDISSDKKIYEIEDLNDKKIYEIKTFDLAPKFKEEELISALILKDIEDNYFFFGGIQSFNVKDEEMFLVLLKTKLKMEYIQRKKREKQKFEWKIVKSDIDAESFLENENELWDNKTKVNGVWVDDEGREVL